MTSDSSDSVSKIEEINEHLKLKWLNDGQIVVFKMTTVHREMIDVWADRYKALLTEWPSEQPLLTLHDFLETDSIIMTPHMRRRAQEFVSLRPDVITRTAIAMQQSLFANATRIFIQTLPQSTPNRLRKIFFTREDALAWLNDELNQIQAP